MTTPAPERTHRIAVPVSGGSRSTSALGTSVLADSLRGVDDERVEAVLESAGHWRKHYAAHFAAATQAGAASADATLTMARRGLTSLRERMVVASPTGDLSLEPASLAPTADVETIVIHGDSPVVRQLRVPYDGVVIAGDALSAQLARWRDEGIVEPAFATAVQRAVDEPDLLTGSGLTMVLLGAGAALGPLADLARWGVDVIAIDVPDPTVQQRISQAAEAGSGRVRVPRLAGRDVPGLSITEETAELLEWLQSEQSPDSRFVLATHTYADGAAHVELTAAADFVGEHLHRHRPDTAFAFLATPTDSFLAPEAAVDQSQQRWSDHSWNSPARAALRAVSGGRLLAPAYSSLLTDDTGTQWGLADTLVPIQGPNYALAKRAQRWRAMTARADGITVSANVAPASWTRSVTKNRVLAAVYRGAHRFGIEIFAAETTSTLMAAKLLVDLSDASSDAEAPGAHHPESLFSLDAAHGGLWRQPFDPRSALGLAAAGGALRRS